MNKPFFLAGALLFLAPLTALLPGCGGGSSGGVSPTSAPLPTPTNGSTTPTETPFPTDIPGATPTSESGSSDLYLRTGQGTAIRYRIAGSQLSGDIEIFAGSTSPGVTLITSGTYSIVGRFAQATRAFALTATAKANSSVTFTLTGKLPTATQNGSYTLTMGQYTESGVLPKGNQPLPTPTPYIRPTATATVPANSVRSTLTFTGSSGSNFVNIPITQKSLAFQHRQEDGNDINEIVVVAQGKNSAGDTLRFNFPVSNLDAGSSFGSSTNNIPTPYYVLSTVKGENRYFYMQGGYVTVDKYNDSEAAFTFHDAIFSAITNGKAKGDVTVRGTIGGLYSY